MSKIWHLLNIDSLANDCNFGLEYYMFGNFEKAKPLLMEGIKFCDMIEKGNIALEMQEIMDSSHLDAFEDIKILVKCKGPDELKIIVEEAASVKLDLMKMIQENGVYPIDKIRKIQKFFNEASSPYLSRAHNLLRRSEKCRSYYI